MKWVLLIVGACVAWVLYQRSKLTVGSQSMSVTSSGVRPTTGVQRAMMPASAVVVKKKKSGGLLGKVKGAAKLTVKHAIKRGVAVADSQIRANTGGLIGARSFTG